MSNTKYALGLKLKIIMHGRQMPLTFKLIIAGFSTQGSCGRQVDDFLQFDSCVG